MKSTNFRIQKREKCNSYRKELSWDQHKNKIVFEDTQSKRTEQDFQYANDLERDHV